MNQPKKVAIIGAGPAGLTAAYLLAKAGVRVEVFESDAEYVGGISRTVQYKGFGFDIGGHRFFSKSAEVNALWQEMLGDAFLVRPRKSRIYFSKRFYPYPLELKTTLLNLGVIEAALCVFSYVKARLHPRQPETSFEDWVINRFGERLYRLFFKTYTEKVWGMPCHTISADWAAQRIKGLSLTKAVMNALIPPRTGKDVVKTLIQSFHYPKRGPGQMWEAAAAHIRHFGGTIHMGTSVTAIHKTASGFRITAGGKEVDADHVISSMPLQPLVSILSPALTEAAKHAAQQLRYRDFLVVALVVKDTHRFDDNWIYVHEPHVQVGRIQNFKSWSPYLVPDASLNCLGLEYFCHEGDGLWSSDDASLVTKAKAELCSLGLATPDEIIEGVVVRQPKAYPVYDAHYTTHVATIRQALAAYSPNLHPVGRAGMHKYNNQDHAMMTAMLTVRNIVEGARYDVWQVNQDAEYHEEQRADSGERLTPTQL